MNDIMKLVNEARAVDHGTTEQLLWGFYGSDMSNLDLKIALKAIAEGRRWHCR